MNLKINKKKNYIPPKIEVLEVELESCFSVESNYLLTKSIGEIIDLSKKLIRII